MFSEFEKVSHATNERLKILKNYFRIKVQVGGVFEPRSSCPLNEAKKELFPPMLNFSLKHSLTITWNVEYPYQLKVERMFSVWKCNKN
jgi:hypothetical protein